MEAGGRGVLLVLKQLLQAGLLAGRGLQQEGEGKRETAIHGACVVAGVSQRVDAAR